MELFVKAVEIWVPGTDGLVLELGSSHYGVLHEFKSASETMRFAYDEGLPGKTWAGGEPIILTDLEHSYFQRALVAKRSGIACAISLPVYCGQFLHAVVVLFCGRGEGVVGAVEVWGNEAGNANELKLFDGYYGDLERFEWVSRRLTIMRGRGLPGVAWEREKPVIIDDLGQSGSFLRAGNAAEVGITTGLAVPFSFVGKNVQILTLLSARGTPIARRFEIWLPDQQDNVLRFDAGYSASGTDLPLDYANTEVAKGQGPLGEVWLTGRPLVAAGDVIDGNAILAIPLVREGAVNSIVCLVL